MFVSKKKYNALVDENAELQRRVQKLEMRNTQLIDKVIDLKFDKQLLIVQLQRKEGKKYGEYFYKKEGENSDNKSK